jgi:hypothetical protein
MSPSSFTLVLGIMLVAIVAIYVTLFSVGTGFGDKADRWIRFGDKEKVDKTAPPVKTESKPEPHEIRHAA